MARARARRLRGPDSSRGEEIRRRRRPIRALLLGPVVAWACGASVALAGPQALLVESARLDAAASLTKHNGRIKIDGVVDDSASGGAFETALLSGSVGLSVADAGQFHVELPLTDCERDGHRIRCGTSAGYHVQVSATSTPFVYALRVRVGRLASSTTGTLAPRAPVRVHFATASGDRRIDTISDCATVGSRRLFCRDLGRPNIVFIVTDDQRWDTLPYMPHVLDRIAANGVSFSNAFTTTPSCAPSRASMLTGQYAHTHGVVSLAAPTGGATRFVGPDQSTLATWLHARGYRTGMYGKYLTDYTRQCPPFTAACYIPPGWDEWHVFVQPHYYNYQMAENGQVTSFGATTADYSTDVLTGKAVDFIHQAQGQPFFLHIGYFSPHGEGATLAQPADRHSGTFATVPPWRPPNYDEEDMTDKPPWVAARPRASDWLGVGFLTYGSWTDADRRLQLESLLAVDEGVEALVTALEETGQAENTVIVFTSDNGYLWWEHRYSSKGPPYEESIRIPLLVRFPRLGLTARDEPRLALGIDLAPTLACLAGVTPPSGIDGRCLEPVLRGGATPWRSDFLVEFWDLNGSGTLPSYAGVRSESWKYVTYPDADELELYNLQSDPYELDNLAYDPSYQGVVSSLASRVDELLP